MGAASPLGEKYAFEASEYPYELHDFGLFVAYEAPPGVHDFHPKFCALGGKYEPIDSIIERVTLNNVGGSFRINIRTLAIPKPGSYVLGVFTSGLDPDQTRVLVFSRTRS